MWHGGLAQLQQAVRSDDPNVRNNAMIELRNRVRKHPSLGVRLLPIFRDAVEHPRDGWTTANAIGGIESICGPDEGRRLRVPFFEHPDVDLSCPAIITSPDAGCVPALIDMLGRKTESKVRIAILQTFGRLRDRSTLGAMVSCLQSPTERPYAIESLGNLGDPRAIPYLEQWQSDPTPTWPLDDRGGEMMTVGDMVGYAIGKIRFYEKARTPFTSSAPIKSPFVPRAPKTEKWGAVLTFVPLAAALFLIPWIFLIVILSLDSKGHLTNTPQRTHSLDLLSAIPPLLGLMTGGYVVSAFRPLRAWQWIVLIIGCIPCAVACFSFGWELFH